MPAEPCPNCRKLRAVAAELIGALADLVQADDDYRARGNGDRLLPPLYHRGLQGTLLELRGRLAEIEDANEPNT